jgi:putative membrane protein
MQKEKAIMAFKFIKMIRGKTMLETGFLGTNAPFYMDVITCYFAILPFLMGSAIFMAIKKRYELHYKMQLFIFVCTFLIVGVFEIGVRISGGFSAFMEQSNVNATFMLIFLGVHILIALITVVLYSILVYSAIKKFRLKSVPIVVSHKKLGIFVFFGMSITSLMGVMIYYFLFLY